MFYIMDFSNFEKNHNMLCRFIKEKIKDGKTSELVDICGACIDFFEEIKVIVQRIETESQEIMSMQQKLLQLVREKKSIPDEFGEEYIKQLILIGLDVKCFFSFSRIFLDTLARVIRYFFGSTGHQLPHSMRELINHKKLIEFDSEFAKGLRNKMSWIDDLIDKRDEITHHLGSMRSTRTIDAKFGFDILGLNSPKTWGTTTVKPILDYINDILKKLSEVILYIYIRFGSTSAQHIK